MLKKINKFFIIHRKKIGRLRRILLMIGIGAFAGLSPEFNIEPSQATNILLGLLIFTITFTKHK
jgi:hypothetical protein